MRPYVQNKEGHTSKAGTALDPVDYAEDDGFGYMFTIEGSGKPVVSAVTSLPLAQMVSYWLLRLLQRPTRVMVKRQRQRPSNQRLE